MSRRIGRLTIVLILAVAATGVVAGDNRAPISGSAAALGAYRVPPPLDAVEAALDGYDAEFAAMRREGLTRELSDETAERVFALGFALEQLRRNCNDLARCVTELAPARSAAAAKPAANSGPAPQ